MSKGKKLSIPVAAGLVFVLKWLTGNYVYGLVGTAVGGAIAWILRESTVVVDPYGLVTLVAVGAVVGLTVGPILWRRFLDAHQAVEATEPSPAQTTQRQVLGVGQRLFSVTGDEDTELVAKAEGVGSIINPDGSSSEFGVLHIDYAGPARGQQSQQTVGPRDLLHVKFRYDEKGQLRIGIGIANAGNELPNVAINLLAPRRYERQYVNRVDTAKNQLITGGSGHYDETPHQLTADAPMSARWMETGLRLFGHMVNELTFFMPYVEGDPIYFKIGGDSLGGWTDDLIAITPPTLAGSKATKEFFPQAALSENPQIVAKQLLAECNGLITSTWEGQSELPTEAGTGDVESTNAPGDHVAASPSPEEQSRLIRTGNEDAVAVPEAEPIYADPYTRMQWLRDRIPSEQFLIDVRAVVAYHWSGLPERRPDESVWARLDAVLFDDEAQEREQPDYEAQP